MESKEEADTILSFLSKRKESKIVKSSVIGPNFNVDVYPTDNPRRGKAIIFNQYSYEDKSIEARLGSEKDENRLREEFTSLGFEVEVLRDKKYSEIMKKLEDTAAESHKDADCLVIVVMSHGGQFDPKKEEGNQAKEMGKQAIVKKKKSGEVVATEQYSWQMILANDQGYDEKDLFKHFEGDKCLTLVSKPKIFIIQACRGDQLQKGTSYMAAAKDTSYKKSNIEYVKCKIPTSADFLIFRSTADGTCAVRTSNGAPFIQILCQQLTENRARNDDALDLESVLIDVKRKVLQERSSTGKILEMPYVYSTLIRKLYLKPKIVSDVKKSAN